MNARPLYQIEFPDFGPLPLDPSLYGLVDISWHNDVCPSFAMMQGEQEKERLWIDYADPENREMQGKRFIYCVYDLEAGHNEPIETPLETDDVEEAKRFLLDRVTRRLGDRFAALLRKDIGAKKFEQVRARNRKYIKDSVCASHDFCDANMVMDAAMRECGFGEAMVGDWVTENDHLRNLWNAAWNYAKSMHLTREVANG